MKARLIRLDSAAVQHILEVRGCLRMGQLSTDVRNHRTVIPVVSNSPTTVIYTFNRVTVHPHTAPAEVPKCGLPLLLPADLRAASTPERYDNEVKVSGIWISSTKVDENSR